MSGASSYEFGPFRVDPVRRRLTKDGRPVLLTPKAFDTLVVLVEQGGRTVTKDELLDRVWSGTSVEENNLTQAISRLRKALDDTADGHRYILTLPGQGYRFVETVRVAAVETETIAERLDRGPVPYDDAIQIALQVLSDLERRHRSGEAHGSITSRSVAIGVDGVTVRAPDAPSRGRADAAADLVAVGRLLFEMLTGRPVPASGSVPPLGGGAGARAITRVILRALSAAPDERFASAREMADDLREALASDAPAAVAVQPVMRLMVLPFRILRPDPDTDFLAFSVPDAITSSLGGLESLVVRSSMAARRFAGEQLDLAAIQAGAAVDAVLCGTLLRDGDELNVNAQLVEVPSGTVTWSQHSRVSLRSIFRLQDELTRRIVESLPVRLTARDERVLRHYIPSSARAYELYLRANQLSYDPKQWTAARDLYRRCVEEDPAYAPAWARLGRIYRVLGLYGAGPIDELQRLAREAFVRAFEIHPDLPLAHNLYTHLEVELGGATEAMLRLLDRARLVSGDAELFAGLVHACRYSGLLDAAIAAHAQAWRLDPQIRTGIAHAYWCLGDYEKAIGSDLDRPALVTALSLTGMGRDKEAVAQFKAIERLDLPFTLAHFIRAMRATVEGKREESIDAAEQMLSGPLPSDPCPRYYVARALARIGDTDRALASLKAAVDGGFFCYPILARDPWLDSLRGFPEFAAILQRAGTKHRNAAAAFLQAGGDVILGMAAR